jgi:hypothetical protein
LPFKPIPQLYSVVEELLDVAVVKDNLAGKKGLAIFSKEYSLSTTECTTSARKV